MKQMNFRNELATLTPILRENPDAKIYVFGAGGNWKNICEMYRRLAAINIDDYIDGFIDNDAARQGTIFHGKQIYGVSDIDTTSAVILISIISWSVNKDILRQLLNFDMYHLNSVFTSEIFFGILMRYGYERLAQFKDKHKDKRCFIIGNGPSLLANDLDRLKNEITFGTNKIFLLFDKTDWRPSYYVCEEDEMFKQVQNEISIYSKCIKFHPVDIILSILEFDSTNFYFFHRDHRDQWKPCMTPSFSEEPFFMSWGATVTYSCLQLAAYMGFSEIYLLGVDWTHQRAASLNGEIVFRNAAQTHFANNYKLTEIYTSMVDIERLAFETCYEYCNSHGVKIRNATRGGALEIFERVDFDSLF